VGADDGGHLAVEEPAHRDLLARRLGVHVDEHVVGAGHLPQGVVDRREGGRGRLHEQVARHVHDAERRAVLALEHAGPVARLGPEEVRGPDDELLLVEVGPDLAVAVGVVAERDHVDPGGEQLVRVLGRDADAAGGVLPVDDHEVERELLAQPGEELAQRAAPGGGDDVADEEDGRHALHGTRAGLIRPAGGAY